MKQKISVYAILGKIENDFQKKGLETLYIGLDTTKTQSRISDHMKPSKIDAQPINRYMQENDNWYSINICELFVYEKAAKELGHLIESYFIKIRKPRFNKNSK